ncbi:LytR/AlgR family response regulator transcription factor [Hymenobacter sp. HD11105]|jgi:DNA-binding LytR/AlgR family response regulator
MRTLTAIALDDEPQALRVVHLLAAKVSFLDLQASFTNAFDALAYLQVHPVDVLFIDVQMPDITGIEFVQGLAKAPMIIFTTAYSTYAVQGFELDAVDYLLKPFSLARFTKACTKALGNITKQSTEARAYIFIKTGYEEEKLLLEDILYIEADGNYLTFVLTNRRLLTRQTMADIVRQLPAQRFVRVHRSFIISLDKVEKIARTEITVAGTPIPIGVSYENQVDVIREKLSQ